jgi:hypothetical protein
LLDWTREKAVLPKMAVPAALDVLPEREIMVKLAYPVRKRGFSFGYSNEVDMIIHKVISDQPNLIRWKVLSEQTEIDGPVMGGEEDSLPMVSPLGDVMHPAWNHYAGTARHLLLSFATRCTISEKSEILA